MNATCISDSLKLCHSERLIITFCWLYGSINTLLYWCAFIVPHFLLVSCCQLRLKRRCLLLQKWTYCWSQRTGTPPRAAPSGPYAGPSPWRAPRFTAQPPADTPPPSSARTHRCMKIHDFVDISPFIFSVYQWLLFCFTLWFWSFLN